MLCFENKVLYSHADLCMLKCLYWRSADLKGKMAVVFNNLQAMFSFVVPVVGLTNVNPSQVGLMTHAESFFPRNEVSLVSQYVSDEAEMIPLTPGR